MMSVATDNMKKLDWIQCVRLSLDMMLNEYISIIILALLFPLTGHSQYNSPRNYNWVFGQNAGINFVNGTLPAAFSASLNSVEAAASVSDENGNLLFYTEGTTIWDRNHNIMPHGDTLTGILLQRGNDTTHLVTYSSTQGALIISLPDNLYYIFSIIHAAGNDGGKLFYSVVDMSLNNGYGDVVPGKKGVFMDSMLLETMVGIKGEDNNVWILVHSRVHATFKAFEVNCNGVVSSKPIASVTGSFVPYSITSFSGIGIIAASPNRRRIALSNFYDTEGRGNLELYDFDPATGIVSNAISLSPWPTPYPPIDTLCFYSTAFSPNNTRLYAMGYSRTGSRYYNLFQHDLALSTPTDIINSRTLIDSCNGGLMRLGPDGKIYMAKGYSPNYQAICRINNPDSLGILCDYEQDVVNISPGYYNIGFGSEVINMSDYAPTDTIFRSFCLQPCFRDTAIVYAPGYQYLWSTGATTPNLAINRTGTYWVIVNGGCNVKMDTYHVYINNLPEIVTTKGCSATDSIYAIAHFPPGDTATYMLSWLDSDNNILKTSFVSGTDTLQQLPGNYILRVRITAPCDTLIACEQNIPFTIDPPLPYRASFALDSFLCQNQTYSFQNTSTGNLDSWYWNFGDGQTSNQQNPQYSFTIPGLYRVTLVGTNSTPCYDTFYRDVVVDTLGQVSFAMHKTKLCSGDNIEIHPVFTGNLTALHWDLGDGNHYQGAYHELRHAYDKEGIYPITLTGKFRACPDTFFTDTISVYSIPLVLLGEDSVICLHGASFTLQNSGINQDGYQYLWNTGATTERIEVMYPGVYALTTTSPHGCSNTASIEVRKGCYIDIPNVFSPNGDGVNDYFFPRQLLSKDISRYKMVIFNRWGQKLYETKNVNGRGWDGKWNGIEQPEGVYVYGIEVQFVHSDHIEHYQGNISLIR